MSAASEDVGAAPTKSPRDENFPVGSRLLRTATRPHVLAFYRFARAADDIADAVDLSPSEKLRRLDAMDEALEHEGRDARADALRRTQRETGCGISQARDLLGAFRQDAVKARYRDWNDLAAYCHLSAEPVGRFLLALHGEREAHAASDALCTALQVLNHLQDCGTDRECLDRIYIPEPWLDMAGGEQAFFAPDAEAARRPVLDAMLDRVDDALDRAADLPALVGDRRLRLEAGVTLALARRLAARLREADPVATRVALSPRDFARTAIAAPGWWAARITESGDRRLVCERVRRARTSFAAGMRALATDRRAALHAIYAFARAVDDVADAPIPEGERLQRLATWRHAVQRVRDGAPEGPLERELHRAATRFMLPLEEFDRLIDGMASDCTPAPRIQTPLALGLYCRRAAGTVGLLAAHAFGLFERPETRREASRFARALGEALQIINILRDIREDAGENRRYIPLRAQDADGPVDLASPALPPACEAMAAHARRRIAEARRLGAVLDGRALRPALLMLDAYERLLVRMEARAAEHGWPLPDRTRHSRTDRLRLGLRVLRGG